MAVWQKPQSSLEKLTKTAFSTWPLQKDPLSYPFKAFTADFQLALVFLATPAPWWLTNRANLLVSTLLEMILAVSDTLLRRTSYLQISSILPKHWMLRYCKAVDHNSLSRKDEMCLDQLIPHFGQVASLMNYVITYIFLLCCLFLFDRFIRADTSLLPIIGSPSSWWTIIQTHT